MRRPDHIHEHLRWSSSISLRCICELPRAGDENFRYIIPRRRIQWYHIWNLFYIFFCEPHFKGSNIIIKIFHLSCPYKKTQGKVSNWKKKIQQCFYFIALVKLMKYPKPKRLDREGKGHAPGIGTTSSPWRRIQASESCAVLHLCFSANFCILPYIILFFSRLSPWKRGCPYWEQDWFVKSYNN